MKKRSFRPLLSVTAAACLLPAAALHAQTTLQSPGGQPGQSAAQPAGQGMDTPMATPMGESAIVNMSPAQSISQPFSPVSSTPLENERQGLTFRGRAGIERDSNVLRTSAGQISDTITQLGLGLRYNQRFSQQRVVVDAEVNHFDYDKINTKYNTLNYAAAWYWRLGNQFEGIASADRRQFRDLTAGTTGIVNRRTERNELFEGGYRLGAAWKVLAGVQHTQSTSTDINSWDGNPSVDSVRLGTSYELPSGSVATLRYRYGDGSFQTAAATGFKDNEVEGRFVWLLSPKTTVDARLGHLKREHDGTPGRDFSGMIGGATVNWEATAKTRLMAGVARDLGSYIVGPTGHTSSDRWFIGPVYRPTVQTGVSLRYEQERRHWDGVTATADAGRTDKFDVLAVGLDWQPRRSVGVAAQWRNEKRDSSLPGFNYRANVLGLSLKLTI
jgi:exopolysaccharide biosynthesis operon protein EpsL